MSTRHAISIRPLSVVFWTAVLGGLYLTRLYSFLLFHSLAELFSIVIACCVFIVAWNARRSLETPYLLYVATAYLFAAMLDGLHLLTYKGMGVFPGSGANVPTQLWIVARYLQSLSLLAAPWVAARRVNSTRAVAGCGMIAALLAASVFAGAFPDCFVEGKGLTPFKIYSEYAVALIFIGSIVLLLAGRDPFEPKVLSRLTASIGFAVLSEISFTLYGRDVYGFFNFLGHFFKIVSFYLLYRAVIATDLTLKLERLVRDLERSEEEARNARDRLEERVAARTAELRDANARLAAELAERQQAQEQVLHLASFPEMNPRPVLEVDLSGAVTFANPAARRLVEDFGGGGEDFSDLLPDDLDAILNDREKAGEKAPSREVRIDGRVFEETIYFPPHLGVARIYAHEITDRVRAEEALRAANAGLETRVAERTSELWIATEHLRKALRERTESERGFAEQSETLGRILSNIHLCVAYLDTQFRFVRVNRAYAEAWGYPQEFFSGKNLFDLNPRWENEAVFRRIVATGEPHTVYDKPFDFPARPERVGTCWDWSVQPVRSAAGESQGLVFCMIDVTERKKMEIERQQSEGRFRALVEHLPVGICIVQGGLLLFRNPHLEALFGPIRQGLEFRRWMDIHPEDASRFEGLCQALDSGEFRPTEAEMRFYPSGKAAEGVGERWVQLRATPIEHLGRPASLVSLIDVTRAKELEHLVRVREKMSTLGHVSAGIAHEIRNPLSGINIYVSNLEHLFGQAAGLDPEEREKAARIVGKINSASEKISPVIQKVMEFSKPVPPRMERVHVNVAVEEAVRLSMGEMHKRGVRLEQCLAPDLPPCRADLRLIEQVVLNLINNAAQAMEGIEGSRRLEVISFRDRDRVVVRVSDSGPGIPPGLRSRIFDPFFTTRKEGYGIGLSFSHRVISDHGGLLSAGASRWGGAEFRVEIPCVKETTVA